MCGAPVELTKDDVNQVILDVVGKIRSSHLLRCDECHLLYRWPQLNESDLARLYGNLPDSYWSYDAFKMGSWQSASKVLRSVFDVSSPINVLDVGAFDGSFFSTLPAPWKKHAIEPSPIAVQRLAKAGIPCLGPYVEAIDMQRHRGQFDAITLFDVFEHLPHPDSTIRLLLKLLRPGGRLLVSTGNGDHWTWRMLRSHHWYLHSAQHVCVGSESYFRRWADRTGTTIDAIVKHPHQITGFGGRMKQSIETVHAWARLSNRRRLRGLIQRLPSFSYLIHKSGAPFTTGLHDHVLVVFRQTDAIAEAPINPSEQREHAAHS
ncbi:MAG: class I SAM-dependent methyltransferase [Planctomycetales bacterium]|nr:class I SAM-dependent methyltransferase [Planctomycetales bacterium]